MWKTLICATCAAVLAGSCQPSITPTPSDGPASTPRVVMQITETSSREGFDRMAAELKDRQVQAVILVNDDFVTANCEAVRDLHDRGYEVMLFIRAESAQGETILLSELPNEEQETLITDGKAALEACLGSTVTGFRATRFDQNEDTYEILDALGFEYNLAFVAGRSCLPGYEDEVLPYRSTEYGFWAIPMHGADNEGRTSAFCDNPFDELPAEEWEAMLVREFDAMWDEGRPLLVEFHPDLSGVDEGRFAAFVHFLEYATENGADFMSVAEYVDWAHPDQAPVCVE